LSTAPLSVGIVGCGLVGRKRAAAVGRDRVVAVHDARPEPMRELAAEAGAVACGTLDDLLAHVPDVVVVATTHDAIADVACAALAAGSNVLVEKPAGRTLADVQRIAAAAGASGRSVRVGFNHRFHPGVSRAVAEARSGRFGAIMFLRARYGHGGRPGYEREWRAEPAVSGGGELLDQGMHLLDLCYWLLGPLPLHSALLRTCFWPVEVEDNAVLTLGGPDGPWATFHVSWTEWRNEFALEVYCERAKLQVTGLAGSYGAQALRIYRMRPELGPPDLETVEYGAGDPSWAAEWAAVASAVRGEPSPAADLASALYGHEIVAAAYARRADERAGVASEASRVERAD
jgi:predicted dehydrogenase